MSSQNVRCSRKDLKRLRTECRAIYSHHHPDIPLKFMTDAFMLEKLIDFYVENDQ